MSKIDKIIGEYWNVIKLISFILSIVISFIAIDNYINNQIENQITNKAFLSRLTKEIRPFLITDGNGMIIYDNGASQFIETITISKSYQEIDIKFNKFIENAPMITPVGAIEYTYKAARKKKFTWVFTNVTESQLMVHDKPKAENLRFVIDVLP